MKPDMLDRKLKALVKLRKTKDGRKFLSEIVRDHPKALLRCLTDAVGKP